MIYYLDDILREVGEPEAEFPLAVKLEPFGECSLDPDFSEASVLSAVEMTDSDSVAAARLCEAAAFLRENPMFRYAAISMYRVIFQQRDKAYISFAAAGERLAESIRMLLRSLSALEVKRWHRERGIPEEYSAATLRYLRATEHSFNGCFSSADSYTWLRQLLYPELAYLNIGRFGFAVAPRNWNSVTFRHEGGTYLSFAKSGTFVNKEGLVISPEEYQEKGGFRTLFKIENGCFYGHPIAENGRISCSPGIISAEGYRVFLRDGIPVINMHIPGGGGMTPEITRETWSMAKRFYTQYLGQDCPKVIACGSWTCSPVMEEILPPDANLVKFVKSVRRLPNDAKPCDLYSFIHKGTSLSQAMDSYVAEKGMFRAGSMFVPLDEIG